MNLHLFRRDMKHPEDRRIGPLNLTDKLIDRNDRNTLLVCSSTSKHIPAACSRNSSNATTTRRVNPFRMAVPFWGQTTLNLTGLSPKKGDFGSKGVKVKRVKGVVM